MGWGEPIGSEQRSYGGGGWQGPPRRFSRANQSPELTRIGLLVETRFGELATRAVDSPHEGADIETLRLQARAEVEEQLRQLVMITEVVK